MLLKTLSLIITLVMLQFTLQCSVISILKLNDSLTKNLLQNPISEEEEEEEEEGNNHSKHIQFIHSENLLVFHFAIQIETFFDVLMDASYLISFCKSLNEPPESN
ncbi:MAG TPA: hypothetical protein PK323_10275 [Bacteroidia bacterium]|nr:hypothetical protein [Bacteroidia bacterium]